MSAPEPGRPGEARRDEAVRDIPKRDDAAAEAAAVEEARQKRLLRRAAQRSARMLAEVGLDEFVAYLRSPWRIFWTNTLAGAARGLGFAIGASLVLSVAGYVLVNWLGQIPFIGDMFLKLNDFLTQLQHGSSSSGPP